MRRPNFTREEQYFVDWSKSSAGTHKSDMWMYLVPTALIAAFAVFFESTMMLGCAFVVICFFRVKEDFDQRKWAPIWPSIIAKYEEALADDEPTTESEDQS